MQVCEELQQSVCGLETRLAELLLWEAEARELYQLLRHTHRRQDPRTKVHTHTHTNTLTHTHTHTHTGDRTPEPRCTHTHTHTHTHTQDTHTRHNIESTHVSTPHTRI